MAILPDNEFYTFEDRNYINPNVSLGEQNACIDNLRNTQQNNTAEINMQTHNLGTDVPSSVGGLTGANSYFSSRYQTPQNNSLAANLRATAQAKALNDVLSNEQAKMQKRYNDAYQSSQVRGSNSGSGGGGGSSDPSGDPYKDGSVTTTPTDTTQGVITPVKDAKEDGTNKHMFQYSVDGKTYYGYIYNVTDMFGNAVDYKKYLWVTVTTPDGLKHYRGSDAMKFLEEISKSNGAKSAN